MLQSSGLWVVAGIERTEVHSVSKSVSDRLSFYSVGELFQEICEGCL